MGIHFIITPYYPSLKLIIFFLFFFFFFDDERVHKKPYPNDKKCNGRY